MMFTDDQLAILDSRFVTQGECTREQKELSEDLIKYLDLRYVKIADYKEDQKEMGENLGNVAIMVADMSGQLKIVLAGVGCIGATLLGLLITTVWG